jgi:hypothetical protein
VATQSVTQPTYRGNFYGLKTPTWGGIEKPSFAIETASQTYTVGDLIYIDTNGTMAICTVSSDLANGFIAGQATKKATGTTGAAVHFRPIIPGDLYNINLFHTTAASAVGTQAIFGTVKGLFWKAGALGSNSNSNWVIDHINAVEGGADSNARVRVIDCPQRRTDGTLNAVTDIYARLTCMFLNYSLASDGNPNQRVLQLAA